MDAIWLQSYPAKVPANINPDEFTSIIDLLTQSCSRHATRPAFTNMGVSLSYAELDQQSTAFAAYLQTLGLARGDRVAIMMPNCLQYPIALFGVLRAGFVVVNVNPLYTARELQHQLQDSGAKAIVIIENFAHTLAEVIHQTSVQQVVTTELGDAFPWLKRTIVNAVVRHVKKMVKPFHLPQARPWREVMNLGRQASIQPITLQASDLAFLQYTGGTTGVAKGAMLTHRNILANTAQAGAWMGTDLGEGENVITALPLYHIFSLTVNCLLFVKMGGNNILVTNPRDFPTFIKLLQQTRFSVITGVNTLFNALLNAPGFDRIDFSALKVCVGGGMAVQRAVAQRWYEKTGNHISEGYGLTETSPIVCCNILNQPYNGSIGYPLPSTEISIRNDAFEEMAIGEEGELCVRGPQVMAGYWQRPDETAGILTEAGWLKTGDIALVEADGKVRITDRKKDMILVSGFNVYPNEIEGVVASHPGVLECAAVGIKDEQSGEAVKLVVVLKDKGLTTEALQAYCKENLTGYKRPKVIEFRNELPKTPVGKVLRRELR
ncbi:AMP-binding protein [Parvibium lacunae]|uniref:Long-chain-fatty-acid--CoA ligase n=1 Tax=Parvibium lacunae TaxID=1888893 RepID=A0A368L7X2_9BURK|nr:AMP-binding protein [Parvibium lacunae]RCS59339.1 long-chain-fatty-acid--CoA ligase [Parvibium lacunae]